MSEEKSLRCPCCGKSFSDLHEEMTRLAEVIEEYLDSHGDCGVIVFENALAEHKDRLKEWEK